MAGRTLAVGDIHGCHVALDVLLSGLAPAPDDTFVILGDVVDRGPGSKQCVDRLLELGRSCRIVLILGNHEEMMLEALGHRPQASGFKMADWLNFGGRETLASYGGDISQVPGEHIEFLKTAVPYWETEHHLFIHANLEPGVALASQSGEWLRWTHLTGFEQRWPTGQTIICGHTPQRSGRPLVFPGWVDIDTLAFSFGWLTALEVETGEIFQANQAGLYRTSWLP